MRRLGSVFVVLFISAGLLGGVAEAGPSNRSSVPTAESLIGEKFRSVKTTGKKNLGDRQIRIGFFYHSQEPRTPKKPTLSVRAGCNTWGATFRVRRGRLSLSGPVASTKMACSRDHDPWIRSKFRKGLKIRMRGERLILTRPAERVRFVFQLVPSKRRGPGRGETAPEPDPKPRVTVPATQEDVHGRQYELIDTIGKKLSRGLSLGFRNGVRTGDNGNPVRYSSLSFDAGCNLFAGDYGVGDGVLTWTEVMSTDMWCQGTDDAWLYGFLTGKPEIGLDGTDLVLRKDGIELVLAQVEGPDASDPEPRVTVPAEMENLLGKSYEAISVIGSHLERPLTIQFAVGTRTGHGDPVTGPALGYYAGCNHLSGWAGIENGELSWTEVISTMIGCWGTQDEWLIPLFKSSPEIGLDGTDLVIRKNGVEIVFRETGS